MFMLKQIIMYCFVYSVHTYPLIPTLGPDIFLFSTKQSDESEERIILTTSTHSTALRETPKNATWTSAIYRFCFTKFMREMLRSV